MTEATNATGLPRVRGPRRLPIVLAQIGLLAVLLAAWEWLPAIPAVRAVIPFLDPFYISSPSRIAGNLGLLLGITPAPAGVAFQTIWAPLVSTLVSMLIGSIAGIVIGAIAGVVLSDSLTAEKILRPFIVAVNAIPRIALIPIIIIIFGATPTSASVSAFVVVVFIVFYNAYAGGRSVRTNMIRCAQLLGMSRFERMWSIRFRYAIAWTFAALPTAISFGLIGAVTAELFAGGNGIGGILQTATGTVNATLTMSIVVVLSIVGVVLVALSTLLQRRVLHWWDGERA
jgi:NitT/TauT family transport system permease protein